MSDRTMDRLLKVGIGIAGGIILAAVVMLAMAGCNTGGGHHDAVPAEVQPQWEDDVSAAERALQMAGMRVYSTAWYEVYLIRDTTDIDGIPAFTVEEYPGQWVWGLARGTNPTRIYVGWPADGRIVMHEIVHGHRFLDGDYGHDPRLAGMVFDWQGFSAARMGPLGPEAIDFARR